MRGCVAASDLRSFRGLDRLGASRSRAPWRHLILSESHLGFATVHAIYTVLSEPVTHARRWSKDGDPPPRLQGSSTRCHAVATIAHLRWVRNTSMTLWSEGRLVTCGLTLSCATIQKSRAFGFWIFSYAATSSAMSASSSVTATSPASVASTLRKLASGSGSAGLPVKAEAMRFQIDGF